MKKAKVVSGILALTLTASLAVPLSVQALATGGWGSKDASTTKFENTSRVNRKGSDRISEKLASLVTAGTITSDQATAIESAISNAATNLTQKGDRVQRIGPLASLVTAGTITSEQSKAVMEAVMEAMKADKSNFSLSAVLSSLVTAGTITSDQATAITTAFENAKPQNQSKDSENQKGDRVQKSGPLASLVTAGTITSEQSKAVMEAVMETMKADKSNFSLSTVLSSLVTAGTITSDQATAITTAFENSKTERGTEQNTERKPEARMQNGLKTILDSLVTAGTITSEQETAVIGALTPSAKNN